jgi:hypothetical protein
MNKAAKVRSAGGEIRWARPAQGARKRRFTVHQAKVLTAAAARRAARATERKGDE